MVGQIGCSFSLRRATVRPIIVLIIVPGALALHHGEPELLRHGLGHLGHHGSADLAHCPREKMQCSRNDDAKKLRSYLEASDMFVLRSDDGNKEILVGK